MTIELHPEILEKNGRKEFVVLPYEEYIALREWMDDAEDLLALREAKREEGAAPAQPFEEVARELGL